MAIGVSNSLIGGGSLKATDALLRVSAPANSVVTISKGSTNKSDNGHLNADDHTVYDYYFIIHQSQFDSVTPWTVTATLSGETSSDTIVIDTADEYDVVLVYPDYWIKDGELLATMTYSNATGFVPNGNGYQVLAVSDTGWHSAYMRIDVTNYKTLSITYTASGSATRTIGIWTSTAPSASTAMSSYTDVSAAQATDTTATFDVTNLSGVQSIGLRMGGWGSYFPVKEFVLY